MTKRPKLTPWRLARHVVRAQLNACSVWYHTPSAREITAVTEGAFRLLVEQVGDRDACRLVAAAARHEQRKYRERHPVLLGLEWAGRAFCA